MKCILLAVVFLLSACDGPPGQTPKIAAPQREGLEKAKRIDQTVISATEESKKKIESEEQ